MARRAMFRLEPAGLLDRMEPRIMQHEGALVHKIQPHGCPPNGTMRMCYVQVAETGEFIGLVNQASLVKTGKTAEVRDLARERREAGDRARQEAREARQREREQSMFKVVGGNF